MTVEKKFTSKAGNLTLRRPHYKAFRNIARQVSLLLESEFDEAMASPEFEAVLQACTVENIDGWLEQADYTEAARLWDEVLEFCEFPSFFAERRRQRFESSKEVMEQAAKLQAAQMAALFNELKATGQLPASFSLEDMLREQDPFAPMMPTPSSLTSTPAGTDGDGGTSNDSTSGGSSATSQPRRAAAKR